ncbi:MAG: serine hydrolase [Chitinophagaceae bacterium]|nr:serine hydrolase [Chitinophagaceae bacterium]
MGIQNASDTFIHSLLAKYPEFFSSALASRNKLGIQVIYTEINRSKKGKVKFTDHYFNLDSGRYFYPASTVKLPVAILALQRLNELKIAGLDKNTTMITGAVGGQQTEVNNDPSAPDGRPAIAHYIKKILLVSDNDAFNRLYEFLGQEYINNSLHKMGYASVQIIHRLDISLSEEENRHTNPIKFIDSSGKVIYEKAAEKSRLVYAQRDTKLGKGFYRGGQLVNEPFDFSKKNRFTLAELHGILKSVMFPEAVPANRRFNLTKEDYAFLHQYMSMMPGESNSPVYDTADYWDTYVRFLYYGSEKVKADPGIRIFNKAGDAYGFLIDAAYIVDLENNIEFLLSAVIHCNSDEVYNDDKYEYESVGLPFLKNLGRVICQYERTRVRKNKPVLSSLIIDYSH